MAHLRRRYLQHVLEKAKNFSPLLGVLGHRQVGKTTLLESLSKHYYSMDDRAEKDSAIADPKSYLKKRSQGWVALDEVQEVPDLFPALKEWVRTSRQRPGQFLLSGSVRFTSRADVRESLTGRILNFELLPFTVGELEEEPMSDFFFRAVGADSFRPIAERFALDGRSFASKTKRIEQYLVQGGLPGICFIRDAAIRASRIHSQLQTILDRDVRTVVPTTLPYQSLLRVIESLAELQGSILDYSELSRKTEVSRPTLRKLIYGLESVFLLRLVPVQGARKGYGYYFEDLGERYSLLSGSAVPAGGLEHFVFRHASAEFNYRLGDRARFFKYYSHGGHVPVVMEYGGKFLGIICLEEADSDPSRSELMTAYSFLRSYPSSKVIFAHKGRHSKLISDRLAIVPVAWMV